MLHRLPLERSYPVNAYAQERLPSLLPKIYHTFFKKKFHSLNVGSYNCSKLEKPGQFIKTASR